MNINGKEIVKGIVKFVGSMGVGSLVTIGLKQNIISKNTYEKIMIGIGSFVLSDMISSKAEAYLDGQVDEMFDFVEKIKGEPVKDIPHIEVSDTEEVTFFDANGEEVK